VDTYFSLFLPFFLKKEIAGYGWNVEKHNRTCTREIIKTIIGKSFKKFLGPGEKR
jgi:hypothetical protein